MGFPGGAVVKKKKKKKSTCQCRTPKFDPWVGRPPGEGNGYPLHFLVWKILKTEETGEL